LVVEGIADKKRHVSDFKTNTFRCIVVENTSANTTPVSDSMASSMNNKMANVSKKNRTASAVANEVAQNDIPWEDVKLSMPNGGSTIMSFNPIQRKNIRQGHIVIVRNREMIPADIVLLASSGDRGCAYIETSSIDGETNLKLRLSAKHKTDPSFSKANESIEEAVRRIAGFTAIGFPQESIASKIDRVAELTTEPPDAHINTFIGLLKLPGLSTLDDENQTITTSHRELPLGADNLLLRGAVLRNTEWAIGIACFTGTDTKLSQNAVEAPSKFSQLDQITNKCVIVVIYIELVCIIYLSSLGVFYNEKHIDEHW
jgi:magnesium-transporting ATPase (P-type)